MGKKTIFWVLAILITLLAAIYQRKTGPTHPKGVEYSYNNEVIKYQLPRSNQQSDCKIEFPMASDKLTAIIKYKRYPSNDEFVADTMMKSDSSFIAVLPMQPPAGKLNYEIDVLNESSESVGESGPVVIRFTGDVSPGVLIPHILFMFLMMIWANAAGLFALGNVSGYKTYTWTTIVLIIIGGMILGPIMQFQAFGEYWAGFPKGYDLTDNKTLIALIFWIFAGIMNIKKDKPIWVIVASIITLIIFSIPHSVLGSELDVESGQIIQAMILFR